MAVELCKVSLWMEALEPGRPLSFLDHRIVLGNSLLGATPELIASGIPPDAFKPILGDDKKVVAGPAQTQRAGASPASSASMSPANASTPTRMRSPTRPRRSPASMTTRSPVSANSSTASSSYSTSPERRRAQLAADTWCTAFVAHKDADSTAITQDTLSRVLSNGSGGLSPNELAVDRATRRPRTRFCTGTSRSPPSGREAGFDVVLGNPPWERVKLQEKEFFAARSPAIANAPNKAARDRLIKNLAADDPALLEAFEDAKREAEGASHLIRDSDRYPLCGRGDVNTYAVFAETNARSSGLPAGSAASFRPASRQTTPRSSSSRTSSSGGRLVSLFDFKNNDSLFYDVGHRRSFFSLLTVTGLGAPVDSAAFVFAAARTEDLNDMHRRFTLTAEDIQLLSPNTRTCPTFKSSRDAELTKEIYRRMPVLVREREPDGNPWNVTFLRMFDMATDSGLFRTVDQLEADGWALQGNVFLRDGRRRLPLYEAKMLHHFDHRYGDYSMRRAGSQDTQLPDVPPRRSMTRRTRRCPATG